MKLRCEVLLRLGLKGVKIFCNKFSGLNSKNLVKDETASCNFVRVWVRDGENSSQHRESWHALLLSKSGFKCLIKF